MDNTYITRRERRGQTEKQKGFMTKVVIVQLVLSLLITGILFLVCRTDTNLSDNIKSFYSEISKTDIAVSQIWGSIKNVAKETFSSNVKEEATGETEESTTGEKAVFSPVFLTVNLKKPLNEGNITSKFGYRVSPITDKYSLHSGLDIASPENTKIYASYDGEVITADCNEINGNYIVIKHSESLKTTYNHCNKLLVKKGERVKAGECIALVGSTGYATGNHLHFEVILNGKYINPLYALNYEF